MTLLYAFLGGLLPAMIWLWFFLREDRAHPEPRLMIFLAFIAGMISVLAVLPIEHYVYGFLSGGALIVAWSAIEEICKYIAAALVMMRRTVVDEPIDTVIYLITAALGFAAFETALFLLEPLMAGNVTEGLLTGNLRFMGAALLHTLSSATVGGCVALAFYKSRSARFWALCTGLILATILHALFNLFIIRNNGSYTAFVFFVVWLGIILLFALFEKAKRIRAPKTSLRTKN